MKQASEEGHPCSTDEEARSERLSELPMITSQSVPESGLSPGSQLQIQYRFSRSSMTLVNKQRLLSSPAKDDVLCVGL